jgi:hypothetical protein
MSQSRNNWSTEEDEIIREFVMAQGLKKWTKIAKAIHEQLGIDGRTGKQCRERWNNNLNPDIKKEIWTSEEENKVFELQEQLGNKWSEIANHLPGRTDNSIKNCFYSAIRRNLRKFNRKKPESEKLKGSLKNLLKRPSSRAILMKKNNLEKNSEVVKPIKIERTYLNDSDKPNDIIRPSVSPLISSPGISPLHTIGLFSFPVTPSTTPSIVSSKFSSNLFSFPDDGGFIDSRIFPNGNSTQSDFIRSESSTPRYFLPHFSPKDNFQHYFSPRNSDSN